MLIPDSRLKLAGSGFSTFVYMGPPIFLIFNECYTISTIFFSFKLFEPKNYCDNNICDGRACYQGWVDLIFHLIYSTLFLLEEYPLLTWFILWNGLIQKVIVCWAWKCYGVVAAIAIVNQKVSIIFFWTKTSCIVPVDSIPAYEYPKTYDYQNYRFQSLNGHAPMFDLLK